MALAVLLAVEEEGEEERQDAGGEVEGKEGEEEEVDSRDVLCHCSTSSIVSASVRLNGINGSGEGSPEGVSAGMVGLTAAGGRGGGGGGKGGVEFAVVNRDDGTVGNGEHLPREVWGRVTEEFDGGVGIGGKHVGSPARSRSEDLTEPVVLLRFLLPSPPPEQISSSSSSSSPSFR